MSNDVNYLHAMVIDDEAFMRKIIALQLRSLGCKSVSCHESGKDALSVLAENPDHVHLVVCDLQMPIMDGVEVVSSLGAIGYRGALILVSGEAQRILDAAKRLAHAHGLNVLGVLNKPVQPARMAWLLNRLGDGKTGDVSRNLKPKRQISAMELSAAIDQGHMVNHYQPKVCLRTGRVMGFEALVRWQHPDHGLIYPDEFVSVAEDSGLIGRLTQAVIAGPGGALHHLGRWLATGLDVHVAVNVSMENLADQRFPDFIVAAGRNAKVSLTKLVLEVTESRINPDARLIGEVLTRLRLKRLSLAIDDFGTGYSSLAQLQELPFDEMKIDRRFVSHAHQDRVNNSILDASIDMARALNMITIGEGVESIEDWRHLQRKGCDMAQGYWIAKPLPFEQIAAWLTTWHERMRSHPELLLHAPGTGAAADACEADQPFVI